MKLHPEELEMAHAPADGLTREQMKRIFDRGRILFQWFKSHPGLHFIENKDGFRSFGWGMQIGGGPWGSPCHWEHHLVASLPWYQQLIPHRMHAPQRLQTGGSSAAV